MNELEIVVDASVVIKWVIPEVDSLRALRLLAPHFSPIAPDLILPELGNILWKRVRRGDIDREAADTGCASFHALKLTFHRTNDLLTVALKFAHLLDRTVYDSLYLALAVQRGCRFVTADRKFAQAVAASSLVDYIHELAEV